MLHISKNSMSRLNLESEKNFRHQIRIFVLEEHSEHINDLNRDEQDIFIDAMLSEGYKFDCQTDNEFMLFSMPYVFFGVVSHYDPVYQPIYYTSLNWSTSCIRHSPTIMVDKLVEILKIEFATYSGIEILQTYEEILV